MKLIDYYNNKTDLELRNSINDIYYAPYDEVDIYKSIKERVDTLSENPDTTRFDIISFLCDNIGKAKREEIEKM